MSKFQVLLPPERLTELSKLVICQNLWTQFNIRKSIKLHSNEHPFYVAATFKLLAQVYENIDNCCLPSNLEADLKFVAREMKLVIQKWLIDMSSKLRFPNNYEKCIDFIRWTRNGDVDTSEVLRAMYFSRLLPDCMNTWELLTTHCLDDCIADYFERKSPLEPSPPDWNFPEIPSIRINPLPRRLPFPVILRLYWTRRLQNRLVDFATELPSIFPYNNLYEDTESLDVILFQGAAKRHLHSAAMFFWTSMTLDQRIIMINKIVQEKRCIDIQTTMHLWQEALNYNDHEFLIMSLNNQRILKRIVDWPYVNLLMRTLTELQLSDSHLEKMADIFCKAIVDGTVTFFCKCKVLVIIFRTVWQRIGKEHKAGMDCLDYVIRFKKNIRMLKFLLHDPVLESRRDYFIQQLTRHYTEVWDVCEVKGVIRRFYRDILVPEEQVALREWFIAEMAKEVLKKFHNSPRDLAQ